MRADKSGRDRKRAKESVGTTLHFHCWPAKRNGFGFGFSFSFGFGFGSGCWIVVFLFLFLLLWLMLSTDFGQAVAQGKWYEMSPWCHLESTHKKIAASFRARTAKNENEIESESDKDNRQEDNGSG